MVHMATPWKHPRTGAYYLRRQIPEDIRPFFGGSREFKRSLKTKAAIGGGRTFPGRQCGSRGALCSARCSFEPVRRQRF